MAQMLPCYHFFEYELYSTNLPIVYEYKDLSCKEQDDSMGYSFMKHSIINRSRNFQTG